MSAAASLPSRVSPAEPASLAPVAEADGQPAWVFRSEAFAEDFDERTLPGSLASPRTGRRSPGPPAPIWPWAVGLPLGVLAVGLVIVLLGG